MVRRLRGKTADAYGYVWFDGKMRGIHQLMYLAAKGPIPAGHEILHECDHTLCVEPDHLVAGTHAENMRDMADKRRSNAGKKLVHVTDDERVAMFALRDWLQANPEKAPQFLRSSEDWTAARIMEAFGVSRSTVKRVFGDPQAYEEALERVMERRGYRPGQEMEIPEAEWPVRGSKPPST